MSVSPVLAERVGKRAAGLRVLSGFLEFVGWAEAIAGLVLAAAIGSQTTTKISGTGIFAEAHETHDWGAAITVGIAVVVSGVFLVAVARALGLFAEYTAAQVGFDLGEEPQRMSAPAAPGDAGWGGGDVPRQHPPRLGGDSGGAPV